jgi:hypothetical protein
MLRAYVEQSPNAKGEATDNLKVTKLAGNATLYNKFQPKPMTVNSCIGNFHL